ncbi:hypothetical protein ACIPPJ_34215 [Streptomyces sp. NPDC086091]|uniref:hypothetical protein n=1 Tax=unclassified Streptomyces TaxID=2593676 RepID=UPI003828B810
MSDQNTDATAAPANNAMPTPPAPEEPGEQITTLNNAMPSEPAKGEQITALNNAMPAPPALDRDRGGK